MRIRALAVIAVLLSVSTAEARGLQVPPPIEVAPLPPGAALREVSFSRMGANIRHGHIWARLQLGMLCLPNGVETWDSAMNTMTQEPELEHVFREELTLAGFQVAGAGNSLFERDEKTAELLVGAMVNDIQGRFCGGHLPLNANRWVWDGEVLMDVEWQVYSTLERRVVARIPTRTGFVQEKPVDDGKAIIFRSAFAANARALAASEEFRRLVLAPRSEPGAPSGAAAFTPIALAGASGQATKIADAARSVVAIFAGESHGSGFLVSSDGHLLTNHHVVGGAKYVKVRWPDGKEGVGEVLRTNTGRDIALVKTDAAGRRPLALRRTAVELGEAVFAIGTPLDEAFQGTLTRGVVSSQRVINGLSYIQSDVTVNGGNSGGPLVDERGGVVGVTVSTFRAEGLPTGINLFIPIDEALKTLALQPQP